jgi:AcrR family transcriptional regulator
MKFALRRVMMIAPASRPGGRSLRVKAAVFAAVDSLLAENPNELPSMAVIAERAGVSPTSLYRRWGEARLLVGAVAVDRLMRELPVPDTGSLRGDLIGWASAAAHSLSNRRDIALLRIMTAAPASGAGDPHDLPIGRRLGEVEAMLARGQARGEATPPVMAVLEIVLAPIYLHALFLGPIAGGEAIARLVDRALALAPAVAAAVL